MSKETYSYTKIDLQKRPAKETYTLAACRNVKRDVFIQEKTPAKDTYTPVSTQVCKSLMSMSKNLIFAEKRPAKETYPNMKRTLQKNPANEPSRLCHDEYVKKPKNLFTQKRDMQKRRIQI